MISSDVSHVRSSFPAAQRSTRVDEIGDRFTQQAIAELTTKAGGDPLMVVEAMTLAIGAVLGGLGPGGVKLAETWWPAMATALPAAVRAHVAHHPEISQDRAH